MNPAAPKSGAGARWAPAVVAVCLVAGLTAGGALFFAPPGAVQPLPQVIAAALLGVYNVALAVLVARRAPRHPASALMAASGLAVFVLNVIADGAWGPWAGAWTLLYLPLAVLLLIVPDGRIAGPWRAVGWVFVGVVAAFIVATGVAGVSPATEAGATVTALALLALFLAGLVACAVAPIARYRRADDADRLRLRWVLLAGTTLPLTLMLCWTSYLVVGGPGLVGIGLVLMYLALPAGVAVSLLRPTLFEVDRALVSIAAAGSLGVVVLLVLSAASIATAQPVAAWPPAVMLVSIGVLAAASAVCFPLAHRLWDRALAPERARAIAALRALGQRIDHGESEPEDTEAVLREALRDPGLVVAVRRSAGQPLTDGVGAAVELSSRATPVVVRGETVGALVASSSRPRRPATAVAHAAGPLVDAVRTRAELARAKAEVEASRERMLRAGYEERRRLERDLHDGAQQRLVALGMRLRVLQRTASADSLATDLDAAVAELGTAVAELRTLAHGVRPSSLDDGLGAALAALAQRAPTPIELDIEDLELPDAVATTAYFVVSEAVVNALRHAEATRVSVTVRADDRDVRIRVDDDGRGGARTRHAGGLEGLGDRVAAIGGRLEVVSSPGGGTRVEALLPCG